MNGWICPRCGTVYSPSISIFSPCSPPNSIPFYPAVPVYPTNPPYPWGPTWPPIIWSSTGSTGTTKPEDPAP